jgi:LCP family protein required for cell wall assembly
MQQPQEPRPRARSAFSAAFLSLIFPGLGHAYARAWYRAVGFAAAPFLLLALLAGAVLSYKIEVLGVALQPPVLVAILVGNVVAYLYRIVAAVDAYRVVRYLNRVAEGGSGRLGPARAPLAPISLAGLLAVVLVMGGAHAAVAYYDLQALTAVENIFNPSDTGIGPATVPTTPAGSAGPSASAGAAGAASPQPSLPPPASGAPAAAPSQIPWNGTGRLNILLIGTDKRPDEGTWNTDTLIVASIDPTTRQVALFSLPRDTVDVPLPPIPARAVFGATYASKINSLYLQAQARPDLFPGGGHEALKDTLGYLYGIPINYYVEVDFTGFKTVVDALGGVTINVQVPVVDDDYPGDNGALRVYIQTGVQRMSGSQALIYARSRHGSNDFDRASRQQRVLLSLRQQADFATLIQRLPALVQSTSSAVKTDFPIDKLPALIDLAGRIGITNVRSFVFAPPYYGTEGYPGGIYELTPNVARIRAAVAGAFNFDPTIEAQRQAIAQEGAQVWVLNGTGVNGNAAAVAGYLDFRGVAASAPNQRSPAGAMPANTIIRVYNGAQTKLPLTLALLADLFGVQAVPVTDPTVRADIIVTTGLKTPALAAPALP